MPAVPTAGAQDVAMESSMQVNNATSDHQQTITPRDVEQIASSLTVVMVWSITVSERSVIMEQAMDQHPDVSAIAL